MNAQRRHTLWTLLAAASGLGAAGAWQWAHRPLLNDAQLEAFWAIEASSPEGEPLALKRFRGQAVVLNFWATWCPPCVAEMPLLDAFYRQNKDKNWQVIGLAIDREAMVQRYLKQNPVTYPMGLAGVAGSEWLSKLGDAEGGLPFTLVLHPDGHLLQSKLGQLTEQEIQRWPTMI